jgi:putative membrane protein
MEHHEPSTPVTPGDKYAQPASAQKGTTPGAGAAGMRLSKDDLEFITGATQGGMFEVESSRIALDKEVSDETREFARMMVDDHTMSGNKLQAILERKSGEPPEQTMSDAQQRELEELRGLEGAAFDARYHECQVVAHDKAIALFERAGRMCDDADLRNFALATLPTLREHRRRLDQHPMWK